MYPSAVPPRNPAQLSTLLSGLFPPYAVVAEMRDAGNPDLLLPGEAVFLGRAVPKRVNEFAAGRLCARRALQELGVEDFAIEVAADRAPRWPTHVVGSITHTQGFCCAVVALQSRLPAVGIDTEPVNSVKPDLWSQICTPGELRWLHNQAVGERNAAATLMFCAKEAFYKCQYPLAGERLGFHDAQVDIGRWSETGVREFSVRTVGRSSIAKYAPHGLSGRYLFHRGLVSTGMYASAGA